MDWIGRIDNGNVRRRKVNRKVGRLGRQSDIGENIKFNQISSQVQPKTNTPSSRSKNCSLSMEIKILVGISIIIKTYMCSCYNFLILVKAKKELSNFCKNDVDSVNPSFNNCNQKGLCNCFGNNKPHFFNPPNHSDE